MDLHRPAAPLDGDHPDRRTVPHTARPRNPAASLIPREILWDLPADAEAAGNTRDMVQDTLTEWGLPGVVPPDLISDVLVVVSELYTNAIQYGAPPITLRLRLIGRCLAAEIADHGTPFLLPPQPAPHDQENGRGLQIVTALATKWDVDPQHDGKVVWFTMCW